MMNTINFLAFTWVSHDLKKKKKKINTLMCPKVSIFVVYHAGKKLTGGNYLWSSDTKSHTFSFIFLRGSLNSIFYRHTWFVKVVSQRGCNTDSKCAISKAVKMIRWPLSQLILCLFISFYCTCRPRDLLLHSPSGIYRERRHFMKDLFLGQT